MKKNIILISPHSEWFYKDWIPWLTWDKWKNKAANIWAKPDINITINEHQKLIEFIIQSWNINVINLDFPNEDLKILEWNDDRLSSTESWKRKYFKDNIVFSRDGFISNRENKIILSKFSNPSRSFEPKVIKELISWILDNNDLVRNIIEAPNLENLFLEWWDFRLIEKDKILFAWFNSDWKTSRNSKSWIKFVKDEFEIENDDFLIIESKWYHLDTVFSVLTNKEWSLIWWMICSWLVDNFIELEKFFNNKWLKLLDIPNKYWVRDPELSPNWNWVINTLNINEYLISSWYFSDEIELELSELWIKRFITSTSQFWEAWWWPHCLTNEL